MVAVGARRTDAWGADTAGPHGVAAPSLRGHLAGSLCRDGWRRDARVYVRR
jgi:hypothetical protein